MPPQKHHHHPHPHYFHSHMASVDIASSFNNLTITFFSFLIILLLPPSSNTVAYADANDTRETPPPPPSPLSDGTRKTSSAFKPGMAVVVGVLTTMFSLTFLLLLYIKHCNSSSTGDSTAGTGYQTSRAAAAPIAGRKNSGIDRSIVESLPIFRFGSLRGHKDGLDCAVCLNKFEASEVLRLLPKCKHAFHVECVDTWLDAHSTCPLCRHRVDPEDILLVEDAKLVVPLHQQQNNNSDNNNEHECCSERNSFVLETRRVSGRHSSVGEKEGGFLEIILEDGREGRNGASFRRSLDSATCAASRSRKTEGVMSVTGWLVRPRKDGMLLVRQEAERGGSTRASAERRVEHRIIVSPSPKKQCGHGGLHRDQRWSDVQPSDLLYLTSEMIISGGKWNRKKHQQQQQPRRNNTNNNNDGNVRVPMVQWNSTREGVNNDFDGGRVVEDSRVTNTRSVSEITGLSRFLSNRNREEEQVLGGGQEHEREREREEGVVSRWLAWISRPHTQPAVR